MTRATSTPRSPGGDCLRFVERRCGSFVWEALTNEGKPDEAGKAAGASVLSLAEVDLGADAQEAAEHEHLAVLALRIHGDAGAPVDRVALRFVTPRAMRSASHTYGSRWLLNDITVPTPAGLDEVSLLLYRVRRTTRLERILAMVENAVEMLEVSADEDDLILGRAVLERLEVLDEGPEAEVVLSGCGLRFGSPVLPGDERFVAVLANQPGTRAADRLWLIDRKLHEGRDRDAAPPINGRPYALLRFGWRSTRQSVREFIEEIRRRNPRRLGDTAAGEGESFTSSVDRQEEQRRRELIAASFGHQKILPMVTPIAVEVAADLDETVTLTDTPPSRFQQLIDGMRAAIDGTLGVRVPGIRVRINETDLKVGTYLIMLDEIPLVTGSVDLKKLLCLARRDALTTAAFEGQWHLNLDEAMLPDGSGRAACWIPVERGEEVRKAGFETWDAAAYIEAHLRSVVLANLEMFVNVEEVVRLFSPSEDSAEFLSQIRKAQGGLLRFLEVIRSLLMEELPIKPTGPLLERYSTHADRLTADVAEELRRLPTIHTYLTRDVADWRLFALAEEYEARIRKNIHRDGDAAVLTLEPGATQNMLKAVRNAIDSAPDTKRQVVVVEDWRLRPFVRSLLIIEFPRVRVVARREIEGLEGLPSQAATISVEQ